MKKVLITGALSGMGLSATKLFLSRGWEVLMVDISDDIRNDVLSDVPEDQKKHTYFFKCDISSSKEVEALCKYALDNLGIMDSIINNAGVFTPGKLHEIPEDKWDWIFNVDVKSIFLIGKYFIPHMIENGGGTIVNTASISGLYGDYNMAAYNAAKGAVVNLAKAMALDYGKYNIRVNNVCPSATATPMFLKNPPETIQKFKDANPLGDLCTPENIAEVMYFLSTDASAFVNGQNLAVSGGMEIYSNQPVQYDD